MMIESIENRVLLAAHITAGTLFVDANSVTASAGSALIYSISKSGQNYHVQTSGDGFDAVLAGAGVTGISVTGQNVSTSSDVVNIGIFVAVPVTVTTGLGNDQVLSLGTGPVTAILGPATVNMGQSDNDTFFGGTGNDSVLGGGGDDSLEGGAGNDTLLGQAGNDSLLGDDGNDSLVGDDAGQSGNDSIMGDIGNDTLVPGGGADVVDGGVDVNTLSYAEQTANLIIIYGQFAGPGNWVPATPPNLPNWTTNAQDTIANWDFIAAVWGGSGDDSIDASAATHVVELDGFAGNDVLTGSATNDAFTPGIGDVLDGGDDNDLIIGLDGDDTIRGGLGSDNIDGGNGNDLIYGGTELQDHTTADLNDILQGGTGNDTLDGEAGDDLLEGGAGNDLLMGGLDQYFVIPSQVPGVPDDTVTSGSDTLQGDNGFDTVDYSARSSNLFISVDLANNDGDPSFNDSLGENDFVTESVDEVIGGDGNDTMTSPAGVSVLFVGNGGDDSLVGGNGNDTLEGDNATTPLLALSVTGNDTLIGGLGNDSIIGGPGSDTASYADRSGAIFVSLDSGTDDDGAAGEGDNVFGCETVLGGSGDDTLVGSPLADCLVGGLGNDSLVGMDGNDTLLGGEAALNTTVTNSTGADVFDGGNGIDVVDFSLITHNLTITLDNVANDGVTNGAQGANVMDNVEVVIGGSGADTMTGGANNDCLVGGSGSDSLLGGNGNDTLVGQAGADVLLGGVGNDSLFGGDGQDILQGNDGDDSLLGGTGSDQMFGGAGSDWVSYAYESHAVRVTLDGKPNDGPVGENDLVNADVENVQGGKGSDILVGNNNGNQLDGQAGNDSLVGLQGNDTLIGDSGSDTLNGGYHNDCLIGGAGGDRLIGGKGTADTADYSDRTVAVFISLDNKANDGAKNEFDKIDSDVEILIGGTGNDSLFGDSLNNTLIGNDGDDTLIGAYGADSLLGGNGNDLLVSSNRKLNNDLANDILDGGAGTDSVLRDGSDSILNIP